jgi:peptidoglycan/LPS O-acetylase OafA/YrhL
MRAHKDDSVFNPAIHSIRGLAAIAVLLFHWEQFFPSGGVWIQKHFPADTLLDPTTYIGFGWMGVPLFFILSGWLLGGQVIRAPINLSYLKNFWKRRFLRIYPAVWTELIVLLLIADSVPGLIKELSYDTLHLQFLLWINLPPFMAPPINLVWWTLPVELGFYLLLPLLGWLSGFVTWRVMLLSSLAITLCWRVWIFQTANVDNYLVVLPVLDSLAGTLFTFMLGFSLNFIPAGRSRHQRRLWLTIGVIFLLSLMQWQIWLKDQYWLGHWILVIWPPLVALAIAIIVGQLDEPIPSMSWLKTPILVWLGHISFGIYLWHFQVMRLLALTYPDLWSTPASSLLALLVTLPATLLLASLSFYLVEKPLIGWGRQSS